MYNEGDWSEHTSLFVVKTDDGGHVQNILNVKTGDAGMAEFRVFDGGLQFIDTNTVYIAFFQVSNTLQDTNNGSKTNWAGRKLIGSYDATTHSMNWIIESNRLGYSASLVYRNFCAGCGNIIVGGVEF